ncbi:hypothetical protein PIB30_061736 [Stylosanthes scabra]|uniref:Uncharacterized protein n=1 Tax=Stylosanthes scabra TaxID=79078 RepID=A0ABU6ZJP5_9FABA|nr:hypothetical protein [Stylosanthes scabra]
MARPRDSVCSFKPHAPLSPSLSLSNSLHLSKSLSFKTLILTQHHSNIVFVRDSRLLRIAKMDRKRKSVVAKGKGKIAMPPTRKSPRLAGLPPSLPLTSPKSVQGPHKLLVLAIAAARGEPSPKAQASTQAPVVEPLKDTKGKKTARISVKPPRKRFSQWIIARSGPSQPKPKNIEVINRDGNRSCSLSGACGLAWPD